ncbi:MAG: methyltransferase domain-containing protein [archaeon YNP-LCB-003-016]|uniref:class I SAM-dependent methyltransferase n=1 Tax=Candidatus Culexarchaeum yellowstonense TaxID=2928963 RepID=UPI0026EBF001|nr:methyltransferase domain-containing protein [Candidatus Culexarchaeum yellowstonense]MCC6018773.1 methyltransferase domain-containing protein [Candidatus Verstraetearchaeota archaeon]MCR6691637.1 methyltransferase domain-containing protein [Candidatus Culexarchaeum yellowstonense]
MSHKPSKREIMIKYNTTSRGYDELYGEEQMEKYVEVMKEMENLKDKVVLDIGCGTGIMEGMLLQAKHIIGLDISIEMIKIAKEKYKGCYNISWVNADAENLPIKSKSIDLSLMITVIQNIPSPPDALKEIERTLKLEGEAIVTYPKAHYKPEEILEEISKLKLLENAVLKITNTKDMIVKLKRKKFGVFSSF